MGARDILRSEPDLSASLQPFRERLAETISWCQRRVALGNLAESLRSPALAPPPATPWPDTIRAVADARLRLLGRSWRRSIEPLGGGLLIVYFPTPPHSSGRAAAASSGYLDERDTPPWDTWVAYVEEARLSYVVAWAPPASFPFLTAATRTPNTALRWLDSSGLALEAQLKVPQPG
jgi:hypothetical protein